MVMGPSAEFLFSPSTEFLFSLIDLSLHSGSKYNKISLFFKYSWVGCLKGLPLKDLIQAILLDEGIYPKLLCQRIKYPNMLSQTIEILVLLLNLAQYAKVILNKANR